MGGQRTPAEQRAKAELDVDTWARRSVELLRWVLDQPPEGKQEIQSTFFGFSVRANPLLDAATLTPGRWLSSLEVSGDRGRPGEAYSR